MRSDAPALFPVFRSTAQAQILAAVLLHPTTDQTVADLSRDLGIPQATVSDEVARLVDAQILATRKVGRSRLLRPNAGNRMVAPLTEIALGTMGPHLAVRDAFADIAGIDRILIYGSWAARYQGQPGPPPNDLDILLIGSPDRAAVYAAADDVEKITGLPVNPVIASRKRWDDPSDSLSADIKANPVVEIDAAAAAAS
ncbi:winged helix-turn-helix domain-containing protein [Mycobacterium sp. 134]|uniref:winged helix-turn-helix domain-containing protein n=1 Tax=Mycobacterium sp. 134 TaxID=3400425 RepID=UPI003AAD603D